MQQRNTGVRADGDVTPDSQDRIEDFFERHGGAGAMPRRDEVVEAGDRGWYEVYAADGYCLRCEWSRVGSREKLNFSELAPRAHSGRHH